MDKINFVNGSQPAINDTNLNKLQTNIENAINGTVLYENEQGTQGDIQLSDSYNNYKKFDIYSKEGSIMTCYNNSNEEGCNIGYPKPIAISSVTMQVKTQQLFFKDSNTITRGIGKTIGFGNPGDGVVQNIVENMIITKIIGYK